MDSAAANAAREALPPHEQLDPSAATERDGKVPPKDIDIDAAG